MTNLVPTHPHISPWERLCLLAVGQAGPSQSRTDGLTERSSTGRRKALDCSAVFPLPVLIAVSRDSRAVELQRLQSDKTHTSNNNAGETA